MNELDNIWTDDFTHNFFLDLLVDYDLLSGNELIEDMRSLFTGQIRDKYIEKNKRCSEIIYNLLSSVVSMQKDFIDDFKNAVLNKRRTAVRKAEDASFSQIFKMISNQRRDFERSCIGILEILNEGKTQNELNEYKAKQLTRWQYTFDLLKEKNIIPCELTISQTDCCLSIEPFHAFELASTMVATYLSGISFGANKRLTISLTDPSFPSRLHLYMTFDKILKQEEISSEVKSAVQVIGDFYKQVKETTLCVASGDADIISFEKTFGVDSNYYVSSFLKPLQTIDRFLKLIIQNIKSADWRYFQDFPTNLASLYRRIGDYKRAISEGRGTRWHKEKLETAEIQRNEIFSTFPAFWYIEKEAKKTLTEIHEDKLRRLLLDVKKIASMVTDGQTATSLKKSFPEYSHSINNISENAKYFDLLIDVDEKDLYAFISKRIADINAKKEQACANISLFIQDSRSRFDIDAYHEQAYWYFGHKSIEKLELDFPLFKSYLEGILLKNTLDSLGLGHLIIAKLGESLPYDLLDEDEDGQPNANISRSYASLYHDNLTALSPSNVLENAKISLKITFDLTIDSRADFFDKFYCILEQIKKEINLYALSLDINSEYLYFDK